MPAGILTHRAKEAFSSPPKREFTAKKNTWPKPVSYVFKEQRLTFAFLGIAFTCLFFTMQPLNNGKTVVNGGFGIESAIHR